MAVDLDNFPYSDAAKRMLSYVTAHWYDKSYVGKWTYEVMGQQMDLAVKYCQELPLQFDVDTATWGLMYWEQMYGLPIRSSLSYEERRRLIHLKMEPRYSSTPYWMAQTIENTTGYTANVYDINDPGPYSYSHPNIFHVLLSGDAEEQFDSVREKINKLKQSHTVYTFSWLFMTIEMANLITPKVIFIMPITWWETNLWNGEKNFDGSIAFDAVLPPVFYMAHRLKIQLDEAITLNRLWHRLTIPQEEVISPKLLYLMPIDWWDGHTWNGKYNFDGTLQIDTISPPIFYHGQRLTIQGENAVTLNEITHYFELAHTEQIPLTPVYQMDIEWWDGNKFDGQSGFNGSIYFNAERDIPRFRKLSIVQPIEAEEDMAFYFYTSSTGGAAFDGLHTFDGTLSFNSGREEI